MTEPHAAVEDTGREDRSDRPTVGLFGLLGSGNLGNDASLEAMLGYLRRRHPDARLLGMCAGPKRIWDCYGVPSIPLHWYNTQVGRRPAALWKLVGKVYDVIRTADFVRRCDVVIVPGMGVLETTLPMRPWGWPFTLFVLTASSRLSATKVALVGVGASDITNPLTRRLVAFSAHLAHYRSYRDRYSKDSLARMGVDTSSDEVHPDIAFALREPPETTAVPGSVGLGLMAYYGSEDDRCRAEEIHAAYLACITGFVLWLVDHEHIVRLFVGDAVDAEVVTAVLDDIRRHRPDLDERALLAEPTADMTALMQQLQSLETVVASRYHNVLAAVKLGKPTVSLSYATKTDILMTESGLEGYSQSLKSLDLDRLIGQFSRVKAARTELIPRLVEQSAARSCEVDAAFARMSAALFPATLRARGLTRMSAASSLRSLPIDDRAAQHTSSDHGSGRSSANCPPHPGTAFGSITVRLN